MIYDTVISMDQKYFDGFYFLVTVQEENTSP